jgi:hypothetical protein
MSPSDDPSDSPWAAMARELARNPDSPASLRIMSAVNASLRPRQERVQALMEAIAQQLEQPGPQADAAFEAAKAAWERVCGDKLSDALADEMRADVERALAQRRRGPPPLESIVAGVAGRTDTGYEHGIHLQGLRGTWHRLWAIIAMGATFGGDANHHSAVATVCQQFESMLGRPLSAPEWSALEAHALAHGKRMSYSLGEPPESDS